MFTSVSLCGSEYWVLSGRHKAVYEQWEWNARRGYNKWQDGSATEMKHWGKNTKIKKSQISEKKNSWYLDT